MSNAFRIRELAVQDVLDLLMEHMEWQDRVYDPDSPQRSPETIWEDLTEAVNLLRRIDGRDEIE